MPKGGSVTGQVEGIRELFNMFFSYDGQSGLAVSTSIQYWVLLPFFVVSIKLCIKH